MKKKAQILHIDSEARAFIQEMRVHLQKLESSGEDFTAVFAFVEPETGAVSVGYIGDGLLEVLGLLEATKSTLLG